MGIAFAVLGAYIVLLALGNMQPYFPSEEELKRRRKFRRDSFFMVVVWLIGLAVAYI